MRKFLKFCGVALGIVVLLAALGGGLFYAMILHFYPSPPAAHCGKPQNALEAQRQDLDYFAKLMAMDRAYSSQARTEADVDACRTIASAWPTKPAGTITRIAARIGISVSGPIGSFPRA